MCLKEILLNFQMTQWVVWSPRNQCLPLIRGQCRMFLEGLESSVQNIQVWGTRKRVQCDPGHWGFRPMPEFWKSKILVTKLLGPRELFNKSML